MIVRRVVPFVALCALVACGSDFDPPSRVTKLRLLAVSADRPYAHSGESIALSALAHDPKARALTYGWATCSNPPAANVMGCLAAMDAASFTLGGATHVVTVPTTARVGLGAMIGVVVIACPGTLARIAGEVPFRCTENGRSLPIESFEVGMKRILVRAADRNDNPTIDAMTLDGRDWPESFVPELSICDEPKPDDCPSAHHIAVRSSAAQSGVDELGTPFTEQLIVQYYATEGTFGADVRIADAAETRFAARPRTSGTTIDLFFVVRDDRGGVTWAKRRARVR